MKINETRSRSVGGISAPAPVRPAEAAEAATSATGGVPRPINDNLSIMGIPEPELTPKVRDALMALMAEVQAMRRDLSEARERLATLERLADRDPLIPVANRRAFVRERTRTMSLAERHGHDSSVVYIDLNDFKDINDTYGHSAGDEALKHVADVLLRNVRDSDVVGRLGGDEFGVILDKSDAVRAREKAETLRNAIMSEPMNWNGTAIDVHVAFGVYTFSSAEDAGHVLAAADRDMYEHKRSIKGV